MDDDGDTLRRFQTFSFDLQIVNVDVDVDTSYSPLPHYFAIAE